MSTVWKVLIGLALVVPMGAYVAGSLVASADNDPTPRHPITIRESDPTPSSSPSPTPTRTAEPEEETGDDDDVEVITPDYDDLYDDHGGDDNSGHGGGGNSGHGGDGGGDHSGHGGGDD